MAPTTPVGTKTLTSPFGSSPFPLNIQGIVTSNAKHFYARGSAYQVHHLQKCFQEAIAWPGFAFVDVMSFCIENMGRRLGFKDGYEMLFKLKQDFKTNLSPAGLLKDNELGVVKNAGSQS